MSQRVTEEEVLRQLAGRTTSLVREPLSLSTSAIIHAMGVRGGVPAERTDEPEDES